MPPACTTGPCLSVCLPDLIWTATHGRRAARKPCMPLSPGKGSCIRGTYVHQAQAMCVHTLHWPAESHVSSAVTSPSRAGRCPASHPTHANQTTSHARRLPARFGGNRVNRHTGQPEPALLRCDVPLLARPRPSSASSARSPPVSTSMDVSLGCLGVGHYLHLTAARPQRFLRDATHVSSSKQPQRPLSS